MTIKPYEQGEYTNSGVAANHVLFSPLTGTPGRIIGAAANTSDALLFIAELNRLKMRDDITAKLVSMLRGANFRPDDKLLLWDDLDPLWPAPLESMDDMMDRKSKAVASLLEDTAGDKVQRASVHRLLAVQDDIIKRLQSNQKENP